MLINKWKSEERVLVIAEIGNNHEGNIEVAKQLIDQAHQAGVDAVKFQTFQTQYYVSRNDKERFSKLRSFELSFNEFEELCEFSKSLGLLFLSTPFDIESALFLRSIVDSFKISSGDNNFYPLLSNVAESGLPIILSTGFADYNQIVKSKNHIEGIWKASNKKGQLSILHCVSAYPVEPSYANLKAIQNLATSLDCTIGYSDHTVGIDAAVASVYLGARIIEKHFTLDHNYSDFRDHQLSADPEEMNHLVQSVRDAEKMLGDGRKVLQPPEQEAVNMIRRSIVSKKDLLKDHQITPGDLTWIRLQGGLDPGNENLLIGKKLNKDIKAFDLINKNDVEL